MGVLQELEGLSSKEVQKVRLPVTEEGELDALAVWFQLHLDEENSLSTGPQEDTCWEQAIYPVHNTKGTVHSHTERQWGMFGKTGLISSHCESTGVSLIEVRCSISEEVHFIFCSACTQHTTSTSYHAFLRYNR